MTYLTKFCLALTFSLSTFVHSSDRIGGVIETREGGISQAELDAPTQVVVLGTGNPAPDPYRAGSSIAVIHKGQSYLFDAGSGAEQRAIEARYKYDIPSLYPSQIGYIFFTHLHSDHTMDYLDISQRLWWRRSEQLKVFGPKGLLEMTEGMYGMTAIDFEIRTTGSQPVPNPEMYQVDATEIKEGIILDQNGIKIEAFDVPHGEVRPAFGYKITTEDKTIVISGDTSYSETIIEKAKGVDLLFHEAISDEGLSTQTEYWQNYHKVSHTRTVDLGRLAALAKPKKVVLYHLITYGAKESTAVEEVKRHFDGEVILAEDLDRF